VKQKKIQELQVTLNQAMFENVLAKDFLNINVNVKTEVTIREIE
jgi:hypothetical protein